MNLSTSSLRRLQLLANGYGIIPSRGKIPAVFGWNDPDWQTRELQASGRGTLEQRIAKWEQRFPDAPTTGVLITGGVRAIDIDVDDEIVDHLMERIHHIAPNVFMYAPTRYGGGVHKMALFVRAPEGDDPFVRIASHKYIDGEKEHCVEIFGGAPTRTGRVSRQFGAYGPHTIDEQGNVVRDYIWAEGMPGLTETPLKDLPTLSKAQALAICDAFEALASASGWRRVQRPPTDSQSCIYDIDDATMFDVMQGGDSVAYAELCEMFELQQGLRVSSSFIDGGHNRSKCQVGWHRAHDCVGVYDHEDAAWHLPKDRAPVDETEFAQELKRFATAHGVETPAALPDWRDRTAKGAARATMFNTAQAIAAAGFVCSEDRFHDRRYIGRGITDAPRQAFFGPITDVTLRLLRVWLDDHYGIDFGEKNVFDAAMALAHAGSFDPLLDMLDDAEASWDGVWRLDRLAADYLNAADTAFHSAVMRKTMIAAVARARNPGAKFDYITVLEGEQGIGKSTAWRVLAGDDYFSDVRVIGHDEREVIEQTGGVWILESADLAGMRKAEVETVKAFASRQVDKARVAYGRIPVERPRRFITVGTTNSRRYMMSQEGNRRFWPVLVEGSIDTAKLRNHRLQLWGEAAAMQSAGESLILDPSLHAEAAAAQEDRRVENPWEDVLAKMVERVAGSPMEGYDGPSMDVIYKVGDLQVVHTVDIYAKVLSLNPSQMHAGSARSVADAMRHLGWQPWKGRAAGVELRGYSRKR